ncbi:MAG TPA: hypothetical protein VEZ41_13525 [Allosphingosinicella sp.]|nr:hypothetical protein [Allosphingosinicella sp.]
MNLLAVAAGILIVTTGAIHSVLGERKLLRPLMGGGAFTAAPRAGRAVRFTWHLATLLMVLTALTVAWPGTPLPIVVLIGVAYLALGLLSLWMTKGRHISGPMFATAGLFALAAPLIGGEA